MRYPGARRPGLWSCVWPILVVCLLVGVFYQAGWEFYDSYVLDLGSRTWPTAGYVQFVGLWAIFAAWAAGFLAWGLARLASFTGRATSFADKASPRADLYWIVLGALAGLAIPIAVRVLILRGQPLTDDESAYLFQAQLLASGRLWGVSPPLKLFFDRVFMINDGRLYAQYFLGWPALMVPGVWLGVPEMMNPVYSALTVPALFLVARRLTNSFWARAGVLLYLSSPMLMVGAATEMAHTSCIMALAWLTWFVLRSRDEDAAWWSHAGVAFLFSVAFFDRPLSALGIGLPLLIWWLLGVRQLPRRKAAASLAVFVVPAVVMGGLFLAVNKLQNGAFTITSYYRYVSYMKENGYRFALGGARAIQAERRWPEIAEWPILAVSPLLRLNFDLFGWPSSFLLTLFAGTRGRAGLLWLSALSFVSMYVVVIPFSSGIDSFGPVHYSEAAWPILLLSVLGLRALCTHVGAWAASNRSAPPSVQRQWEWLPLTLTAALVVLALVGFDVVRFRSLARIASEIDMPNRAVKSAGLHHAIVFAPRHVALPLCLRNPTRHFVLWAPNNDPDLTNDVLWANHISVDQDRRLMEHFPGRKGYVLAWLQPCTLYVLPLDKLREGMIPDGIIGGTGEGPE